MNDVDLAWCRQPIPAPDDAVMDAARMHQAQLIKPPGALGELEALAIRLAGLQGRVLPRVDRVQISVFAADHGIAVEQVSAFPQAVTAQMIDNFAAGGAAISVLARALGATLEVIDLGTVGVSRAVRGVRRERIAARTANFSREAAMSPAQLAAALASGGAAARRAHAAGAELLIGGEMGIANTSSATALAAAVLGVAPQRVSGPGTGLDAGGIAHKIRIIERALVLHCVQPQEPLELLRRLGGFEIAALVGYALAGAQLGLPMLVDGFIASSAALIATRQAPACAAWLLFAHRSTEPGHRLVLDALAARPLLELGLRLGEGSGAALAVPLLRLACALHAGMASFAEAGVARGS